MQNKEIKGVWGKYVVTVVELEAKKPDMFWGTTYVCTCEYIR